VNEESEEPVLYIASVNYVCTTLGTGSTRRTRRKEKKDHDVSVVQVPGTYCTYHEQFNAEGSLN
jgi:hypothetical protein